MGTITPRKRSNGTIGYTAQIRLKRDGKVIHSEANTFDRKAAAESWVRKREKELAQPGALERAKIPTVTLAEAIDKYMLEARSIGRSKAQVLNAIKTFSIADMECSTIQSADIVAFGKELMSGGRQPQTVANYLSHLAAIFAIAAPAWSYPLDRQAMVDASTVLRRLGTTSKSRKRDRRPTIDELDRLIDHFMERKRQVPQMMPMSQILLFALFSTRRQDEITRITFDDLDVDAKRIVVRDMKNPGAKIGNDVICELPDEALAIATSMPRRKSQIFPFSGDAISANFTRACQLLGIIDLHFHDLRHEGISRLFEMGRTVPQAASVSGHRSWQGLQRYTHLRQTGDKFADWKWRPKLEVKT